MMSRLSEWTMIVKQANNELARLRYSNFVRDAASPFVFNLLSRAISFFGTAYAMRCLGPLNVGISALVQTTVQQVALAFNRGFDTVAAHRIAMIP
jgi:O-antigen/teichoic acid export membrane protein